MFLSERDRSRFLSRTNLQLLIRCSPEKYQPPQKYLVACVCVLRELEISRIPPGGSSRYQIIVAVVVGFFRVLDFGFKSSSCRISSREWTRTSHWEVEVFFDRIFAHTRCSERWTNKKLFTKVTRKYIFAQHGDPPQRSAGADRARGACHSQIETRHRQNWRQLKVHRSWRPKIETSCVSKTKYDFGSQKLVETLHRILHSATMRMGVSRRVCGLDPWFRSNDFQKHLFSQFQLSPWAKSNS